MPMGNTRLQDQRLVARGNKIEEGLSDWEVNFIESLNKYLEKNETLTVPQRKKLEEILEDKE